MQVGELAKAGVNLLPFGPGQVESQDVLWLLECGLEVRPDPGRVPCGFPLCRGGYSRQEPPGKKPEAGEDGAGGWNGPHHGLNVEQARFVR